MDFPVDEPGGSFHILPGKYHSGFFIFAPSVSQMTDISPELGEKVRNLLASQEELFD